MLLRFLRTAFSPFVLFACFFGSAVGEEFPVRFFAKGRDDLRRAWGAIKYIEDYIPSTGEVKAYVDDDGFGRLVLMGFDPVELFDTSAANAAYAAAHPKDVLYHSYDELTAWVHSLSEAYPSIVRIDSLGPTVQGRWIWVLRITDNPDCDEAEPEFVYISTMHGDEPVGTELLIWLCDSLVQNYGVQPRITRVVDSLDLWGVPLMNPDGNVLGQRYNANGVDLNRNFPVPDGVAGYDGTYDLEPETQAMMDFLAQRHQVMTINFHTGAVCVNYPWDFDTVRAPDDPLLVNRSLAYSIRNPTMYYGVFPQGITNGYDWYEVDGSMQDWDYHTGNGPHLTVELYDIKWPSDSELPSIWEDNYEAMLHQLELALSGVHGVVVDSITGEPIFAQVWIDQVRRWVETDMPTGDFHHELLMGGYTLTVVADGYYPKRVPVFIPHDSASVWIEVRLSPAETLFFSDFEADDGGLSTQGLDFYQDWAWGEPSLSAPSGPGYVPSGTKLWATKLSGNYSDSSQSRLILEVDLTGVSEAALVYDEWYRFQGVDWGVSPSVAHDGGRLLVVAGDDTYRVAPPWGYDCATSEWNWIIPEGDSVFADDEPGTPWHKTVVFLDSLCGQRVTVIWEFGSSNRNTQLGWYIDDVGVFVPGSSLSVGERVAGRRFALEVSPNPFNARCRIEVELPEEGFGRIISVDGRAVETFVLPRGSSRILWQPKDLPGGVYLLGVYAAGRSETRRLVLLR